MIHMLKKLFRPHKKITGVHHLFEEQALKTPHAKALYYKDHFLTYQQLQSSSSDVAHGLIAAGAQPQDVIGLCLPVGTDLIVALLAILKAGAAYVPITPNTPLDRQIEICRDAKVKMMIVCSFYEYKAPIPTRCYSVSELTSAKRRNPAIAAGELAYVFYTSGSTGKPKGVEVTHKGLLNVINIRLTQVLSHSEASVIPLTATMEFDASVAQIFTPLCSGGTLVLLDSILDMPSSPMFSKITCLGSTPSVIRQLLTLHTLPSSLEVLLLGGENVDQALCQLIWRKTSIKRLINLYGPTEATVHVSYAVLFDRDASQQEPSFSLITIGKAIANTQMLLLDDNSKPCPQGEPGHIYITGVGLAKGYRNNDHLTAQAFMTLQLQNQSIRAYRTGDIGIEQPTGEIQFLGREDRQVKIFGYRVELDEIEAHLTSLAIVSEGVVEAFNEQTTTIVAFVAGNTSLGDKELILEIKKALHLKLPASMQPKQYQVLPQLPTTKNGKIDRKLLRAMPRP